MAKSATRDYRWGRVKMNSHDVGVVATAAAASTYQWWEPIFSALPDVFQGIIYAGTIVYVVTRAANEVIKFWKSQNERKDNE
jgi:hypothetical protein